MIDFMANIKNKKSMKKYNVKTLAEIAVLCIFCNNIQVWSMNGSEVMNPKLQEVMNPNPKNNSPITINEIKMNENSFKNMNSDGQNSQKILLNSMGNTSNVYMLNSKHFGRKNRKNMSINEYIHPKMKNYILSSLKGKNYNRKDLSERNIIHSKSSFRSSRKISSKKINKNKENNLELLFFNKKGHLSLCCCINFFNGNMKKTYLRKLRKIGKNKRKISSECSEYAESSQKDNSNDENNYEPRPAINNNTITLNGNTNFQVENNNGKNFTNGNPDSGNPQKNYK